MMSDDATGLYDVFVKREGRFIKINPSGLELTPALQKGSQYVQDTAAASFKVVPRGNKTENIRSAASRTLSSQVFGMSKRDPTVFVQKANKRISSGGEKMEITFKGIRESRLRKRRRMM